MAASVINFGNPFWTTFFLRPPYVDAVRVLLEHGANADLAGHHKDTPLYLTLRDTTSSTLEIWLEIERLLLAHGADPNLLGGRWDTHLLRFLHYKQQVMALLEAGANPTYLQEDPRSGN